MASVSSSSMLRSSCSYCYKDYMGSFKTQALLFRNHHHHHRRMLASKPFILPGCLSFNINHRVLHHIASDSGSPKSQAPTETEDIVPTPIVIIDQDSESDATVVELSFGDRLGALLDTTKSLKDLGLDVVKGSVSTDQFGTRTKFYITRRDTGRKVDNPESLEAIRLTIISNLLKYHPESSERLAMGEAWGIKAPKKKLDVDIATHINVASDGPKKSLLTVETADRPGLLMEIVQVITHINLDVESAEIDTEGLVAKDKFHVSYHGTALDKVLAEELRNCLRYHLRRPEASDDSY